jgi:CubicO group peptidase (beta-lactamase class C family)
VKDLLTHNIGLGNADLLWARGDLSRAEILKRVKYIPAAYSLRGGFTYQNVMYGAAGELIARVSGMSWEDFVRTRIFAPLGMTHSFTTYAGMHAVSAANQSEPHFRIRDTIRVIADETVDVLPAAGSIWSNATDMAKWVRFLLDCGRVDGKRLVSEAGFRELLKPQSFVTASEFYPTAQITKPHWTTYGLGWFEQDFRGRFLAFHTGSLDGRTAMMGLLPDAKVGVFIGGNLDHAEFRHALLLQVMDLFAGTNGGAPRNWSTEFLALYRGIHERGEKAAAEFEAKRVTGTKPTLPLAAYTGTFMHPLWGDVVIAQQGASLTLHIGPSAGNTGTLEHFHYDTFRTFLGDGRGGASYVSFVVDAEGKVSKVLLYGDDADAFTRVELKP